MVVVGRFSLLTKQESTNNNRQHCFQPTKLTHFYTRAMNRSKIPFGLLLLLSRISDNNFGNLIASSCTADTWSGQLER